MATVSGAAPCQDSQSGAEMDLNSTLDNPNWISRHIFPPTRAIVNGASRMFASVFGFESSSSSSSSSECGSCSDDTHDNDDQEVSSQGVHTIEDREPQSFAGKNEPKRLIEQLLMQESFSRQECDKLTDIIKSRVMDSPSISGLGFGRLNEMPDRTGGSNVEIHDFCSTAVLEAKKLLEMKKSEMHHRTSALNYVTLKHDVEGEEGSPVGMAKSYMRTCPPWTTPSKNNTEFRYPSPYSIGGNFLYSSKVLLCAYSYRKRDSPATGSWNIQDEIRKVRSKATEEMLRTLSSTKIDWSSFPLEHKNGPDSIVSNNFGPAEKDKSQSSKRPVDAPLDLAAKPGAVFVIS
ncbi:hypothetical protein Goari_008290 [Gossypium aridum]|uniref:Uncharacterized protein n=1 Tax=Gossypium aridum TaxID=34290 RepID=A0A7J8XTJ3_GOSAI|nr:hypothetical protein [Gossypium aridum]